MPMEYCVIRLIVTIPFIAARAAGLRRRYAAQRSRSSERHGSMDSSDDEGRGRQRVGILELSPQCATDNNFLRPPSPHSPGSPASGKRTSPSLISCAGRILFFYFDFRFFFQLLNLYFFLV